MCLCITIFVHVLVYTEVSWYNTTAYNTITCYIICLCVLFICKILLAEKGQIFECAWSFCAQNLCHAKGFHMWLSNTLNLVWSCENFACVRIARKKNQAQNLCMLAVGSIAHKSLARPLLYVFHHCFIAKPIGFFVVLLFCVLLYVFHHCFIAKPIGFFVVFFCCRT